MNARISITLCVRRLALPATLPTPITLYVQTIAGLTFTNFGAIYPQ